ncbi:nucleotidyltransferase family protein [Alicyclobacillus mengziensis]|uniref:UbiD family decarboxylase n=1 Tax=Alicyclobacillus mengziensis TaxID=2931921 RepID=A0A9X7VZI3_9BACL|nr:hypothetical protein [Alicyclobacillus mengziensis]QSO47475.1 hypothetical protein JZ786_24345 [Alicyclobacillus mengziensis]
MMDSESSSDFERVVENTTAKLHALESQPESFERTMKAVASITTCLMSAGIQPIIVGGHAVELYTFSSYTTKDVDLVLEGYQKAGDILERLGFTKIPGSRHWYCEALDLPIEIPDTILEGSYERISKVAVGDDEVYVISIEDLLIDRLRAGVFWKSTIDMEQAEALLRSYANKLDLQYLDQATNSSNVEKNIYEDWINLKNKLKELAD